MSKPLVLAKGKVKEISGVEIEGEEKYFGEPIFVVPDQGILRNVKLKVTGPNEVVVTRKPGYLRTY